MTGALAFAGIPQVNLARRMGLEFLAVPKEIEIHFVGLILAASLFLLGICFYVYNFWRFGLPTDEAAQSDVRAVEDLPPVL